MNDEQTSPPDRSDPAGPWLQRRLWRQPIEAVHQLVQAMRPDLPCICAYLDACARICLPPPDPDCGRRHLIVLPLFLGTGKHAREDIPRLLDELRRQHPGCRFDLQTAAGENPRVTSLLAQLARGGSRAKRSNIQISNKNSFFRYLKHNDASS
jgi:sirohydrochlorin cobaltochelatase